MKRFVVYRDSVIVGEGVTHSDGAHSVRWLPAMPAPAASYRDRVLAELFDGERPSYRIEWLDR